MHNYINITNVGSQYFFQDYYYYYSLKPQSHTATISLKTKPFYIQQQQNLLRRLQLQSP
jgi:hypothetical protein